MVTILEDLKAANRPRSFVSGEMPGFVEEMGSFWKSRDTHHLTAGDWTSGTPGAYARQLSATKVMVVSIPVTDALATVCQGRVVLISPSADTSNRIEYSSRLNALRRLTSERFIVRLRSDDPLPIGELRKSDLKLASVDQELAARQRELLARAGGGLSTIEVAQRLNVSEQEVEELRSAGRLLGVPDPDGEGWAYPGCQFEGPRIVAGFAELLSHFGIKSPWTRLYVLIGEDPALGGRSPIEVLKAGDLDMVSEIVRGYGQQGGD